MTSEPADLPPLESEPPPPRFLRPWHWCLMATLVGYPVSVGPVVWLLKLLDPNLQGPVAAWTQIAYFPLEFLFENIGLVHDFYDWYLGLFGIR